MTIHTKLQAIQTDLKAPKGQYNSFGKYKYRSCEIFWRQSSALAAAGLRLDYQR